MSNFDNKGRFGLWQNKEREKSTHPHLSGKGEDLNGQQCWVSAWFSKDLPEDDKKTLQAMLHRYEGQSNKPFINLSIKAKQAAQPQAAHGADTGDLGPDYAPLPDDDIPF